MAGFLKRDSGTVNRAGGVNPASSPNVSQYGWTSYDSGKVNQLVQYVEMGKGFLDTMEEKILYVEKLIKDLESSGGPDGLVLSVNGQKGVVNLRALDIPEESDGTVQQAINNLRGVTGTVISSPTAPSDPFPNQRWFNTSDGAMYLYYRDADSSQWIEENPASSSEDALRFELSPFAFNNTDALDVGANSFESVRDLELAVNKLGVTLEGTERVEVVFTAAESDDAKKLIKILKAVPAGAVFCGIVSMDSAKAEISVRQSIARSHIGFSSVGYKEEVWNGKTFHVATIGKIGQASKFRMSYYDGTERTVGETLTHLGFRNCRVATNASPRGSGSFPSTINNGKLIPGDSTNTYFISSCFYTADGVLHVVPHKDVLVEKVVKDWYYNHGAIQSMHFRYVLVKDGALYDLVGNGYTTETGYSGQPSGRTSIGQHANGQLILAVTDGNTTAGTGVTIKEMSEFMLSKGCVNAMNLDGSGSSTMYVNGELKNSPSDGQERKIPNIIYFQ